MKLLNEILWPILCRKSDKMIETVALRPKFTNVGKKNNIGLSMKGESTDKYVELTKEVQKKWAPKSFKLILKSQLMLHVKSNHHN